MKYFLLTLLAFALTATAHAAGKGRETGLKTPRFVSLKASEVNLRKGPGTRYPIDWVYRRKHMPVEVLEEFGYWRQIRASDGTIGWLHKQMLSGSRYALITAKQTITLSEDPEADAALVVKLEPGVIAKLEECNENWCELTAGKYEGWAEKSSLYGAYAKELYNP